MRLHVFSVLLFFLISLPFLSVGQTTVKLNKKDFKTTKSGFNSVWTSIEEGENFYLAGKGTYQQALEAFLKAHDYNPYYPELNYLIGICSYYTSHYADALAYFKEASEFNKKVTPDLDLMIARSMHQLYQFDSAALKFQQWLDTRTEKELKKVNVQAIQHEIEQCKNGINLIQDTVRVIIENMGSSVNSGDDDYNIVFSPSWDRFYYTSRRQVYPDQKRNLLDNKFNEDIYVSYFEKDSSWGPAQNIGEPVNSKSNEAALLLSDKAQTLFLYRGGKSGGDVYYSKADGNKWGKPHRISSRLRSKGHESSISLTGDGNTMYFVSDRGDMGEGGRDIYVSEKNEKGKWENPVNLGPIVNSPFDEEGVFVSPDGSQLYFSSQGHNSMGGFDVFRSEKNDGEWSEPLNLGFPVNSPADDLFFVQRDTITSYISTNREGGFGWMDMYSITYLPEVEEPVIDTVTVEVDTTPVKIVPVVLPVIVPKPRFYLTGRIFDEVDSSGIMARIEVIDMNENNIVATGISNSDSGSYRISVKRKTQYGVEVESAGYMFFLDILDIPDDSLLTEFKRDFYLKKIKVGQKVVLHHIYFGFNKSNLNPESAAELNRVTSFLDKNPDLRIEVSGHTDSVGSAKFNQQLSENRAKAVVDYLVSKGIDPSRLEYKGYGFSQPVATNDTEEGRAQNRRVEFKIIQ